MALKTMDRSLRKSMFTTPNQLHSVYFTDKNMFYSYQMWDPMKSDLRAFSNSKTNVTINSSLKGR